MKKNASASTARTPSFDDIVDRYIQGYELADHPEFLGPLCKQLGLSHYYDKFLECVPEDGKDPVYHGRTHGIQVALNCYEGGIHGHLDSVDLKPLVVMGMFHDVGHSRGKFSDHYNVQLAKELLNRVHAMAPDHLKLTPVQFQAAQSGLTLSEFPYKTKTKSQFAQILRDADMTGVYTQDVDTLISLFTGLHDEMNHALLYSKPITVSAFCEKQTQFLFKKEWFTVWGKRKAMQRNWPQASKRMTQLIKQHWLKSPTDALQ